MYVSSHMQNEKVTYSEGVGFIFWMIWDLSAVIIITGTTNIRRKGETQAMKYNELFCLYLWKMHYIVQWCSKVQYLGQLLLLQYVI